MTATLHQRSNRSPVRDHDPESLLVEKLMDDAERVYGPGFDHDHVQSRVESIAGRYFHDGEVKVTAFLPLLVMRELVENGDMDAGRDAGRVGKRSG